MQRFDTFSSKIGALWVTEW